MLLLLLVPEKFDKICIVAAVAVAVAVDTKGDVEAGASAVDAASAIVADVFSSLPAPRFDSGGVNAKLFECRVDRAKKGLE